MTTTVDGVEWATGAEVVARLGPDVSLALLRDWRRRRLIRGYRVGRLAWYALVDCEGAEHRTRTSGKSSRSAV